MTWSECLDVDVGRFDLRSSNGTDLPATDLGQPSLDTSMGQSSRPKRDIQGDTTDMGPMNVPDLVQRCLSDRTVLHRIIHNLKVIFRSPGDFSKILAVENL